MPRSSSHRRSAASYNGYGQTTVPIHAKDPKAAEASAAAAAEGLPSYHGSGEFIVAFHTVDAALPPPAYGRNDLAAATTEKEKAEKAEIEAVRVAQEAIDASVLAEQREWEAFCANMVEVLLAEIARMDAVAAAKAAEKLVVFDDVVYERQW